MTELALRANTGLVAIAWIGSIPGLSTAMVGSTLPADTSKWAANGFIEVTPAGSTPALDYALRKPVVSAHCWAVNPGSGKPPVGQAANLAETVAAACRDESTVRRTLTLPVTGYPQAQLRAAIVRADPRPAYGDLGNYAHYVLDIEMDWIELP
jgi:hypothetical protein